MQAKFAEIRREVIIFLKFYIFEEVRNYDLVSNEEKIGRKNFQLLLELAFQEFAPSPLSPILHPFASLHRTSQSGRDSIRFRPGINQLLAPSPASIFTGRKKGGARRGISALFAFIIPCDAFNRVPLNRRRQNTVSPPSFLPPSSLLRWFRATVSEIDTFLMGREGAAACACVRFEDISPNGKKGEGERKGPAVEFLKAAAVFCYSFAGTW